MGTRWRGMLAPIDQPTGDGRRMARGSLTHRPLPLPLKWQRQDEGGHTTSVVIGSMDRLDIDEEGGAVWGEGELFDDASPSATPRLAEDVAEAKLLLEKKVIGPSVDPGSAQAVTVIKGSDTELDDQMMERYWMQHGELPETELLFTGYEIAAATLVPVPAFAQCRPFELLDPLESAPADVEDRLPPLVAAAGLPPLDPALFTKPDLDTFTRVTMRDLGNGWTHVYGHIAAHSTCHVGMRGVCTTAPYSDHDYMPFHRYSATRDGHQLPVAVGRITSAHGRLENTCRCHVGNDDHACGNLSMGGAIAHHDRMSVLAYVCAGEDEGLDAIWFSGVLAPEATDEDIAVLQRRKVSGDWRAHGESMELVEVLALARREPGFPLPRVSIENGRQLSLTAAGVIMPEREDGNSRLSGDGLLLPPEGIDYDRLGAAVARHLMEAASGGAPALTAGAQTGGWDDMPIAPGDREWDKGAAIRRLVEWADGDIEGRYARAFLWRDYDADPGLQGAYKFPVADVIDGELTIVPNAVRNAASRLSQADIPAEDMEAVGSVIESIMERIHERDGGEAMTAASAEGGHTGAMVALRMTDEDAARLAVPDGLPPEEMHMTLAYLGEAGEIGEAAREKIIKAMTKLARKVGAPITADGFAVSRFNPGDANDRPTAIVMGIGGEGLADLQQGVVKALGSFDDFEMPEQHSPWHAHSTLRYSDDAGLVDEYSDRVGPLTFDRLRLAFAGEVIDIPLGEIIEDDEQEQEERDDDAMYAVRAANAVLARARLAIALEELDHDPAPAG